MDQIKVMLVEEDTELRQRMDAYFSLKPEVSIITWDLSQWESVMRIEEIKPDVVLLDIIMPRLKSFELLSRLRQIKSPERPRVIAMTELGRDDLISRALELGVHYYMVKPINLDLLHQRVMETAQRRLDGAEADTFPLAGRSRSMDDSITTMFLMIGMPPHIRGYQFLQEAVRMVIDRPERINRITKELYPGIADRFDTTASKVERAIRHAIEVAWSRGRVEVIDQIFGFRVCALDAKPTNGEFIALVADRIRTEWPEQSGVI